MILCSEALLAAARCRSQTAPGLGTGLHLLLPGSSGASTPSKRMRSPLHLIVSPSVTVQPASAAAAAMNVRVIG